MVLSLEMFETDVQATLDEYLRGDIREQDMLAGPPNQPAFRFSRKDIVKSIPL